MCGHTVKCEKKNKGLLNVIKVQLHVILVLHNMRMIPSNVRKNKRPSECYKSSITSDVSTVK